MSATDGIFVGSATRTTSTPFQVNLLGGITASKAIIKGTSEGSSLKDSMLESCCSRVEKGLEPNFGLHSLANSSFVLISFKYFFEQHINT